MVRLQPGFGIVHKSVMLDPTLKIEAKALYAVLQSFRGSDSYCFPSIETLAWALDCAERSVMRWIEVLETKGLVRVERERGKVNTYEPLVPEQAGAAIVTRDSGVTRPLTVGSGVPVTRESPYKEQSTKNNTKNRESELSLFPEGSPEAATAVADAIPYEHIIGYLNDEAGTSFLWKGPKGEANRKLIRALWEMGYRGPDFKAVIKRMCGQWGFAPRPGQKDMRPYLRPSTLFRKSHFEEYLHG